MKESFIYEEPEGENVSSCNSPLAAVELKPSEIRALQALAAEGPLTAYRLSKVSRVSLRVAYPALKELAAKAYVQPRKIGWTRAGMNKIEYDLTFWGLCNALALCRGRVELSRCIKKWRGLDNVVLLNLEGLQSSFGEVNVLECVKHAASEVASKVWLNDEAGRVGGSQAMLQLFRSTFFTRLINPVKYWRVEKYAAEWRLPAAVKEWLIKWLNSRVEHFRMQLDWATRFLQCLRL